MSFLVTADFQPEIMSRQSAQRAFLGLLQNLRRTRRCGDGWFMATPQGHDDSSGFDPLAQPERILPEMQRRATLISDGQPNTPPPRLTAEQPGTYPTNYAATLAWEAQVPGTLQAMVEFARPHATYGMQVDPLIEVIDALVRTRGALRVSFYFSNYRTDHWPIDIQRRAIGWMGWVPFDLAPGDVPEAARVVPMRHGTLVLSADAFWLPHEHPDALLQAQAVDRRLNTLVVLPTIEEL